MQRLQITNPGVYENILVDGEWVDGTLVKIDADDVTLRNCEIRNGRHTSRPRRDRLFRDNGICFRLRGGTGEYDGALVRGLKKQHPPRRRSAR